MEEQNNRTAEEQTFPAKTIEVGRWPHLFLPVVADS